MIDCEKKRKYAKPLQEKYKEKYIHSSPTDTEELGWSDQSDILYQHGFNRTGKEVSQTWHRKTPEGRAGFAQTRRNTEGVTYV